MQRWRASDATISSRLCVRRPVAHRPTTRRAAMEAAAAAEPRPRHPQAFWIGNVEMSPSRAALAAERAPGAHRRARHPLAARARQRERGDGARAATDAWVTLQTTCAGATSTSRVPAGAAASSCCRLPAPAPRAGAAVLGLQLAPRCTRALRAASLRPLRRPRAARRARRRPAARAAHVDAAAQVARERLGFGAAVAHAVNLTTRWLRAAARGGGGARGACQGVAAEAARAVGAAAAVGKGDERRRGGASLGAGAAVLSAAAEALAAGASEAAAREAVRGEAEADDGETRRRRRCSGGRRPTRGRRRRQCIGQRRGRRLRLRRTGCSRAIQSPTRCPTISSWRRCRARRWALRRTCCNASTYVFRTEAVPRHYRRCSTA